MGDSGDDPLVTGRPDCPGETCERDPHRLARGSLLRFQQARGNDRAHETSGQAHSLADVLAHRAVALDGALPPEAAQQSSEKGLALAQGFCYGCAMTTDTAIYTDRGETHRITAVKTPANRRGDKFKVVIHIDDLPAIEVGGNRSARAQAVLISRWYDTREQPGCFGVRGDLMKAQNEAASMRNPNRKIRGEPVTNMPKFFVAVPVTLDPSHDWTCEATVKALG